MTTALVVTCVTPTANQQYALQESHSKVALKAPSPRVLCAPCPPLGSLDLLLNRSPSMPIEQALLVLGLSLLISLASEFISWLLVYRTSSYLRIRDELDRNSRRLEQFKQGGNKKDNEKKGKKLEESVKNSARDYQQVKMKANMVTGAVNLLVLNRLLAAFEGTPVARLPFQPPGWMASNVMHRGLPGDDVRDCNALFIYILCTTFWKLNLAQACSWSPSRAAERAMRPQQTMDPDKAQ